ncbi:MAG: site-2 protease family protein [Desulfobacterales bacterium]|jgi:Zn-dependent protease/CBS domain-containing protein|nr:site-2 protease family protein [Desulfobacterales bacterium]MDD3081694.1 site-2 protease family protein [Desulfobacterales bacterium]MDD3949786.1 site-2 protease family protein [Desulfobacterales bacterium]MDY0377466.1 site-2 protease family protein [Desulfobacterales bacterium]
MFGKRIDLFRILGFEVRIDLSWVIVAILIAWSLSTGVFPFRHEGLSAQTYWTMGILGAIGLFLSIIFHEMSHSLVARKFGIAIKGITLFIFGGVAEMKQEPPSPKAEFFMAAAGPLSSLLLALMFYALSQLARNAGWPEPVDGILRYLAWINGMLAVFNLVPAFPLDGGRILRSVLWGWKKNLRWATRIAAGIGSGFGLVLIFLGFLQFFSGNFIGGMWWFFIGMFLRGAAGMSYRQLLVRRALEGEPVRRFMKPDPVTVSPSATLEELAEDYIYRYQFKLFPVVDKGNQLLGCVTIKMIKEIPRKEWSRKTVGEIVVGCSPENTIDSQADAMEALSLMNRTGSSRIMVTEENRLVGILSLKDMLSFLDLKVELEP